MLDISELIDPESVVDNRNPDATRSIAEFAPPADRRR